MTRTADALLVQDWRGRHCENVHITDAVIVDNDGDIIAEWGDSSRRVIPRSAIKSIQTLPLIMSGAADAFDVSDDELALACASHGGEPLHVDLVHSWLVRVGLADAALECGPSEPIDHSSMVELYRLGFGPDAIHNCCSGKHTGMLTTALHQGDPTAGYIAASHPVQEAIAAAQSIMASTDLSAGPVGIDGCGIPVYAFPLHALALSIARIAAPAGIPDDFAMAALRIRDAIKTRPWLVSGSARAVVKFTNAIQEPIVIKSGADGVFMGGLPDREVGFALKVRSGNGPAAEVATDWLLRSLEVLMDPVIDSTIYNKADDEVGRRVVIGR